MSFESISVGLSKALQLETSDIDYQSLLTLLREFRSSIALQREDFRLNVVNDGKVLPDLVALIEKVFRITPRCSDTKLAFGVGVQCLVNLMAKNGQVRTLCAELYAKQIIDWLETDEHKQNNYVCAALLNVDIVNGLSRFMSDATFTCALIDAAKSEVEFAILLLQNLLAKHYFALLFEMANEERKLFLLELLMSVLPEEGAEYKEEVVFIGNVFKRSCDNIMSVMPSMSAFAARELALEIELLANVSCIPGLMDVLQQDGSLIVTASYLLRGIHECITQKTTWKDNLRVAVDSINMENDEIVRKPFFGVKSDLVRLLGNLAYKHTANQDQIREAGCLPIILDSCKLDGENPFIKEWSVLSIRNLCDGNASNQAFIQELNFRKCDVSVDDSMSLTLSNDDLNPVRIAPIRKL